MRNSTRRILVVIPALNEEASVGQVVREVHSAEPNITCLVVDDGSTDDTKNQAILAGARCISLPYNLGVGGAMRVGFKFAVEHDYDAVIQVDADGQHDPKDLPHLLNALEMSDIVVGSRFAGSKNYKTGFPRRLVMVLLANFISHYAGVKITDSTSGYRAAGKSAIQFFAKYYPAEYLGDTVESLLIAARNGLSITEVPVHMSPRIHGTPSQNPVKASIYLSRVLVALTFAAIRPRNKEIVQS